MSGSKSRRKGAPASKRGAARTSPATKENAAAKAAERKAHIAAQRKAAERAERRGKLILGGVITIVAVALVGFVVYLDITHGSSKKPAASDTVSAIPQTPAATAVGRTSAPPWAAPADASAAVKAAGLPMLGSEGTALHIHVHLDVLVNGKAVPVPAEIGIDPSAQQISPLHTHDTTGVVHIESPEKNSSFSLGQFFTEWDVALSAQGIGGLNASATDTFTTYVNGKQVTGDPAAIILHAHDEIALVYGPATQRVAIPSTYKFENGL